MSTPVEYSPVTPRFDPDTAIARFGLILLQTDLTSERELARIIGTERAGLHATRIAFDNPTTPDNLRQMAPRLSAAAELLLPGQTLQAVCFSCTTGSVVIGDDAIAGAIQKAHPGVAVVTPSAAAVNALRAMGVSRVAMLTPYLPETSAALLPYFSARGVQVTRLHCLGVADDRDMARISADCIIEAASHANSADAQALFISCTALPALQTLPILEARLGKPVISSNQASAWALLRQARLSVPGLERHGRVFAAASSRPVATADTP